MLNCCYKDNKNIFSTIEIGPKREINPHFGPISTDGCPVPYSSGQRLRTDYTDSDPDLEADFYLLRRALPPAVLVENFFMDSRRDYAFLLSSKGRQAIINLHIEGDDWVSGQ